MATVERAVISVAGLGSRLGLNMTKCLLNIGGKTLIERQLELLVDVPEVRLVVGYQEEAVVEHVSRIRDDVIFVRNSHYESTSLLESQYLGVRHSKGPFLAVEGDVVFEPSGFKAFLSSCEKPGMLGITQATTDDALYVDTDGQGNELNVTRFHREGKSGFEWTGLAYLDASWITNENAFAFEKLAPMLPMSARVTPAFEIDTPADLIRAQHVLRANDWSVRRVGTAEERFRVSRKDEPARVDG